jgi:hypothetical protein
MGRWTEQSNEQGGVQGGAQSTEHSGQRAAARSAGRGAGRPADEAQMRRLRRAELLLQRQRAAERRRQRGFGLRLPSSQPLVFLDPPAAPPA